MPMQQLSTPPSANSEVRVNENFEAIEHQSVYGKRHAVTTGLTWGYYGGRWGGFSIADGTLTLTNAATNRVVVLRSTGAISTSTATTNWNNTGEYARVYQITTAGSVVTAVEDHRAGPVGVHGYIPNLALTTIASASTIAIPVGARAAQISGTTAITNITATGHAGAIVTLIFQGALTFTDGGNLRLNGNFVTTANDTITLISDGTNWFEIARAFNSLPAISTVASSATIAIPLGARAVVISGTTTITSITATGHAGAVVTLIFSGALTFTDGSNLQLAGNFSTAANATITIACDGTNWFEVARSTN
jgi:hypothetical protein